MREVIKLSKIEQKGLNYARISFLTIILILGSALIIVVFGGNESGYSGVTKVCISCHNDSDFPNDTNGDQIFAPFKRPHNDSVMCESCHIDNPHKVAFIQADGTYGTRSTAASCPECHQRGIPNNDNFTKAPRIIGTLSHSSKILNGSIWGSYWNNTEPATACIYCHDNTTHNVTAFGRILQWSPNYQKYGEMVGSFTCAACHYKGDANYSRMNSTFTEAGLPIPPEITNGTNWNGTYYQYYNHLFDTYDDHKCASCHGSLLSINANLSEFVHNVAKASGEECIGCHTSPAGIYPPIDLASFGEHRNVNNTDGQDNITNKDCMTCHYNTSNMSNVLTYACTECHMDGNFSAPIIANHKPPKTYTTPKSGYGVNTSAYCSICHNNSINAYNYSINASVGHYGTNSSLMKPTVNTSPVPVNGFVNPSDAAAYNKPCNNCHNPPNTSYGAPTDITNAHTSQGTCNQCHVNANADTLHNGSLRMPVTFSCIECHTIYADQYKAPNLTDTNHESYDCSTNCHGADYGTSGQFDVLQDHGYDMRYTTYSNVPTTDVVSLNGIAPPASLSVPKGTVVRITSRIKDFYLDINTKASRVRGAEYYYGKTPVTDPGPGKGIPMSASDGMFNASNGAWESINGTLDTRDLSEGTYTIYVRGMDIGKQWSSVKSATLIVTAAKGYINGKVTSGVSPTSGALISVTGANTYTYTNSIGDYSLEIESGTYNVTASKRPEYYDNTTTGIVVTPGDPTIWDFILTLKPTGNITGTVRNATS